MPRSKIGIGIGVRIHVGIFARIPAVIAVVILAVAAITPAGLNAQSISVYQTTPDLLETLSQQETLHFSDDAATGTKLPLITVDDGQRFQVIDGFGASLTDAAAWLFAKKLTPAQTEAAFKSLFSRKDGIALSFLRQPIGSSDLSVTFYSYDDLCHQTDTACTTPAGMTDPRLEHYSLQHDEEYILPLLKKGRCAEPRHSCDGDAVELPPRLDEDFRIDAGLKPG